MFCEYSNLFGEPNTGFHSFRIFNIAIVDVIATLILAKILHIIGNKLSFNLTYWGYLLICFIIGIISHRLFCVRTTIDKILFIK
jgi:hypothetical protein